MELTTSKILERLDYIQQYPKSQAKKNYLPFYMLFKSISLTEVVPDLDNAILYFAFI